MQCYLRYQQKATGDFHTAVLSQPVTLQWRFSLALSLLSSTAVSTHGQMRPIPCPTTKIAAKYYCKGLNFSVVKKVYQQ